MSELWELLSEATVPAWWGAIVSSILAVIKGWELWKNRFRIEFFLNQTSSTDEGNEIHIRNLSPDQIILSNWEVLYKSESYPFGEEQIVSGRQNLDNDIIIAPKSTRIIPCSGISYCFSTNHKHLKERAIFLRLDIAGHGKICRKIYS